VTPKQGPPGNHGHHSSVEHCRLQALRPRRGPELQGESRVSQVLGPSAHAGSLVPISDTWPGGVASLSSASHPGRPHPASCAAQDGRVTGLHTPLGPWVFEEGGEFCVRGNSLLRGFSIGVNRTSLCALMWQTRVQTQLHPVQLS
jgi:hypothetical protein